MPAWTLALGRNIWDAPCPWNGAALLSFTEVHDNASIRLGVVPREGGDPVTYDERRWVPAFAGTMEKWSRN